MLFYVILRRETGNYITKPDDDGYDETAFVATATRYATRKNALASLTPNTCVCGPYSTDDFGGHPG